MVACVVFTPAEMELAGVALWLYYPVFGLIGFVLFYLQIPIPGLLYWVLRDRMSSHRLRGAYFVGSPRLRTFRPLCIASRSVSLWESTLPPPRPSESNEASKLCDSHRMSCPSS